MASLLRITSIGKIRDEDVACKTSYLVAFNLSHVCLDTFIYPYLWSHVEPATAIWCACIMTYRPLLVEVRKNFLGVFSRGRPTSSESRTWYHSKVGADGDRSTNSSELMGSFEQRGIWRQIAPENQDLNIRTTPEKHIINSTPISQVPEVHEEDECLATAVDKEASLV